MSHGGGLKQTSDGITEKLNAIVKRGRSPSSYLDRVVWPAYQQAQIVRWETENASEGQRWPSLNPVYEKKKRTLFAAYPGSGSAMMVATSRLSQGAQGRDGSYFGRIIQDDKITVAINTSALPYAAFAAKTRPFMAFSEERIKEWTDGLAHYVMKGHK